jgi:hypothetical protein
VHDSALLNRVTAANQRVLLGLAFAVAIDTCAEPVEFAMDVAVTMQTRDARPPSKLLGFLGGGCVLRKTSTVFSVRLTPPLMRLSQELWRLDTAEKCVRGEEALGSWKPRGLSVVEDYNRLIRTERRAVDVQAVHAVLAVHPPKPLAPENKAWIRTPSCPEPSTSRRARRTSKVTRLELAPHARRAQSEAQRVHCASARRTMAAAAPRPPRQRRRRSHKDRAQPKQQLCGVRKRPGARHGGHAQGWCSAPFRSPPLTTARRISSTRSSRSRSCSRWRTSRSGAR